MKPEQTKPYELDWNPLMHEVPEWFRDAKFGLFFHWGPYAVPAYQNEWYSRNMYAKGLPQNVYHTSEYGPLSEFGYKDFFKDFKGENFDPENWAKLIKRSGAKYAGPVTEHSDNFSMWESDVNPVNCVNYGIGRDVVGELQKAIKNQGLRFIATFHHQWLWGWFMSSDPDADVYNPENEKFYGKALPLETSRMAPWRLPDAEFNKMWMDKVNEVVDRYDPDLVYFDSRTEIIDENYRYKMLDNLYHGKTARNDRIMTFKLQDFPVGTGAYDVECGHFSGIKDFPWQTDDRLENRVTWCYVQNPKYRPAVEIIHHLCDVVSKNGNLLLNVGPKADGTFPDQAREILYEIGDWLNVCGEAIYGTRPFNVFGEGSTAVRDSNFDVDQIKNQIVKGAFSEEKNKYFSASDIRFTKKGTVLYAISLGCPEKNIVIESLKRDKLAAYGTILDIGILGAAQSLEWVLEDKALIVSLKGKMPSPYANVLKITFDRQL